MRLWRWPLALLVLLASAGFPAAEERTAAPAADTLARAKQHYDAGVDLFESGNKEQALVEFQLANEHGAQAGERLHDRPVRVPPGPAWSSARAHYQAYLAEHGKGELADLARLRIEAINRRPGVFAINTVPDAVDVRIEGEGKVVTGQAPNEFRVPRGNYRVTASKPNFASETASCPSRWRRPSRSSSSSSRFPRT